MEINNYFRIKEKEYGSKNNEEESSMGNPFYGPAASCDELGKIGYILNGYYLVNGQKDSKFPRLKPFIAILRSLVKPMELRIF